MCPPSLQSGPTRTITELNENIMNNGQLQDTEKRARELARQAGFKKDITLCHPLAADGSNRVFWRLGFAAGPGCVVVFPPSTDRADLAEAAAGAHIGRHLAACGVSVPRVLHHDPASGGLVMEDGGDLLLHDIVRRHSPNVLTHYYRLAIEELARFQAVGAKGFDPAWCHDTPRYDTGVMIEREALYFYRQLCEGILKMEGPDPAVTADFQKLAARVAGEPAVTLIHRDFQCRNLMIRGNDLIMIDFQGARFGPPAYDLASLLRDPYAALPASMQEMLLDHYLMMLAGLMEIDAAAFRKGYPHVALQRNLQIIGAFCYLGLSCGKTFFIPYIVPALESLGALLRHQLSGRYPALEDLWQRIMDQRHLLPEGESRG